jgi:hypothetical protein
MPCPSNPPWLDHSNYTWRRSLLVIFRNKLNFYGEELLALPPSPKLEDHPFSIVRTHPTYCRENVPWKAGSNLRSCLTSSMDIYVVHNVYDARWVRKRSGWEQKNTRSPEPGMEPLAVQAIFLHLMTELV